MGLQSAVSKESGYRPNEPQLVGAVSERIAETMIELSELAYGFAFSNVIDSYWRGMKTGDDDLKQNALRWLRGEYATKTEAKKDLPDCIIEDGSWYEILKIFAVFVKKAGYKGLLVFLDEGVNLYKIPHKQARDSNYEKLLTIFNDTMQGKAQNIGVFLAEPRSLFMMSGVDFLTMMPCGHGAKDNRFSSQNFVDFYHPGH